MDVAFSYPSSFYEKTLEHADPKIISNIIDIVEHRLGTSAQFEDTVLPSNPQHKRGNLDSAYMKSGNV